jgi:hypothetical protein
VPGVAVLTAGDHTPLIAGTFVDETGKTGAAVFWHTSGIAANVGVIVEVVVILRVVLVAHCPEVGVKVYVAVPTTAELTTGDQVPVIGVLLVELLGKTGTVEFKHISETGANVGIVGASTVIVNVVLAAHCPAEGVNA